MTLASVTEADFERARGEFDYYDPCRWEYYRLALQFVKDPVSVLELGPHRLPLFPDGDTIDNNKGLSPTYCHDAGVTPWPVDKHYDLFIGLQVWEHLGKSQSAAFAEVMRIADRAVLSFPYKWNCPGNRHHAIDDEVIAIWTQGVAWKDRIVTDHKPWRVVFYWEF